MSNRTTWKLPALVVALTFFLCAPALAGKAQIPKTGQTECYDTYGTVIDCTDSGQDAAIQAGVAWPSPRFKDNADGSVTDKLTGLMWTKDANLMATRDPGWDAYGTPGDGIVSPQNALDYIKKLNAEKYLGHEDWRLPNIVELESPINAYVFSNALSENSPFTNFQAAVYISSTLYENSLIAFSGFTYSPNQPYESLKSSGYVWPVRSTQSGKRQNAIALLPLPHTKSTAQEQGRMVKYRLALAGLSSQHLIAVSPIDSSPPSTVQ